MRNSLDYVYPGAGTAETEGVCIHNLAEQYPTAFHNEGLDLRGGFQSRSQNVNHGYSTH